MSYSDLIAENDEIYGLKFTIFGHRANIGVLAHTPRAFAHSATIPIKKRYYSIHETSRYK
jgi:hypothetical protein